MMGETLTENVHVWKYEPTGNRSGADPEREGWKIFEGGEEQSWGEDDGDEALTYYISTICPKFRILIAYKNDNKYFTF